MQVNWHGRRLAAGIFFFSSRRRHTRLQGDWSSDVCSSDLLRRHLEDAPDMESSADEDRSVRRRHHVGAVDRKSTRLNSSHLVISYAVFCLKKKNNQQIQLR